MLKRALVSSVVVAGLVAGLFGGARQGQAASVLLATIPPPSPSATAVNDTLNGLNATGKSFVTGVSLIAKFEVSGTTLVPETGSASSFNFTTGLSSGEIKSGSFSYTGGAEILYYTLKAGTGSQLFGFFDAQGNQIALKPGEVVSFMTAKGLSNATFYGRPIPESASVLLLLVGGALVARATRRERGSRAA